MQAFARLRVEVDSSPVPVAWVAPTVWTQINAKDAAGNPVNGVKRIHIERGQDGTYGPVQPGEMLLTLDDRNGYLDRSNPASPFASLLAKGRQLRVVHVRSDTAADQVLMHDKTRSVKAGQGPYFGARFFGVDHLGELGAAITPSSLIEYELARGVKYPRPTHLFPFGETETGQDVQGGDNLSDFVATPFGSPKTSTGGGMVPYSDIGGFVGGEFAALGYFAVPVVALPAQPPWSYMILVRGTTSAPAVYGGKLGLETYSITAAAPFQAQAFVYQTDGVQKKAIGGPDLGDNVPHMISMGDSGTALYVYADGVFLASVAHTAIQAPTDSVYTPGKCIIGTKPTSNYALLGIWSTRLVTADWAAIWADIQRPWANQSTDQRLTAILDVVAPGIAKSYTLGTAAITHLPVAFRSRPALEVIRRDVESADGRLWVTRSGVLRYSHRQLTAPGAALRTYGIGGTPIAGLTFSEDTEDRDVVTHVVANNGANVVQEFHDTAASKASGEHRLELKDLTMVSPGAVWDLAERTVHYRKAIPLYVSGISIDAENPAVNLDDTLALDLYDIIAVAHQPRWSSTVITEKCEVIGITHDGDAEAQSWETRLRLRPPRPQRFRMAVGSAALNQGATTPNSTALAITGPIDIRVRMYLNDWGSATNRVVASKRTAGQESWQLLLGTARNVGWYWWDSAGVLQPAVFTPLGALNMNGARPLWMRVQFEPVNPGGVWGLAISLSDDGNDWRDILRQIGASASSLRAATGTLNIGANPDGTPLNGRVLSAEVRNGLDGPVAARFAPTADSAGAMSWTSSTGETWTVGSASTVEAW